jgi:hypothetical protein
LRSDTEVVLPADFAVILCEFTVLVKTFSRGERNSGARAVPSALARAP